MAEEKKTPPNESQETQQNDEFLGFLGGLQEEGGGDMPQFFDRRFAGVDNQEDSVSREEYYRISGDDDRTKDYEDNLSPIARTVASDQDGSLTNAVNIYARRAVNSWRDLTGQERLAVNNYDNKEDFIAEFLVDGGVPISVGVMGGIASLAGVAAMPILLGTGAAIGVHSMIQAGGEKEEVERQDTILEPIANWASNKVLGRDIWDGFIGEKGQRSYGRRVGAILLANALDGFAVGKAVKSGGKLVKKFFKTKAPKEWVEHNVKMLDEQAVEVQDSMLEILNKGERKEALKEMVRNNKYLDLLRKEDDLILNGKFLDEEITKRHELMDMVQKRNVTEDMFPPPVSDAKTVARQAGGRHHLAEAGKALDSVKVSDSTDTIVNKINTYTDRRLVWETTPRGQAGKTRVGEKKGLAGKEKLEEIGGMSAEESLQDMSHTDILHAQDEIRRLIKLESDILLEDKMTGKVSDAFSDAYRTHDIAQTLVKRKAAIDMAYSKGLKNKAKEMKRVREEIMDLSRRYPNMDAKARVKALKNIDEGHTKLKVLNEQALEAGEDGNAMYAFSLGMRSSVDNWLSKGAFENTVTGNTVSYGVASISTLFKEQGIPTAMWDFGHTIKDGFRYVGKRLGSKEAWKQMWEEMSSGKSTYRTRTEARAGTSRFKKIANAATAMNQQLLQETDNFYKSSFKQIADREALRVMIQRRMRNGIPIQQIRRELDMAVKGERALPLDYSLDWSKTRENWHKRIQFRADKGEDAPMISKPWWFIHSLANDWRGSDNILAKMGGQALGVFSRVGANAADWAGRNTILGLADVPENVARRLKENKAEMVLGTAATLWAMTKDNLGNNLVGHHNILTESRVKGRSFGMNPGIMVGENFVELKTLGGVGTALEIISVSEDILNLMMAEKEMDMSEKMSHSLHKFYNYVVEDSWLGSSLGPVLASLTRSEPGERSRAKDVLFGAIPGKGMVERLQAFTNGYRPDAYFLDTVKEMSEWLPVGPSRDAFGDMYTNTYADRVNAEETGFPVGLGHVRLLVNPSAHKRPFYKAELNDVLLGLGAFSDSKTIRYETKSGKVISFDKNSLDSSAGGTLRPLNRRVSVQMAGTFRMTERDYHAAKALLSLRKKDAEHTMEVWEEAYRKLKIDYDEDDVLTNTASQYMRRYAGGKGNLDRMRRSFNGFVPNDLIGNDEKGMSDFLHYIATASVDDMPIRARTNIKTYARLFRKDLAKRILIDRLNIETEELEDFSLLLARKRLVVEMYDNIRERVAKISAFSPSVVEQVAKMRLYSEGSADDASSRNTP